MFGTCLETSATVQRINGLTMRSRQGKKKGYLKKREKSVPTSIAVSKLDRDITILTDAGQLREKQIGKLDGSGTLAHQTHGVLGGSRRDKLVATRRLKSGIREAGMRRIFLKKKMQRSFVYRR